MAPRLGFEFVDGNLTVAYRASAEPQTLDVHVKCAGKPMEVHAPMHARGIAKAATVGAIGGAEFHPTAGVAKLLSGPLDPPASEGPEWHYSFEVASMSPRYIRNIVHRMAYAGARTPPVSMSIVGSLAIDDTPMSITERTIAAKIDDPYFFPEAWPKPPFAVQVVAPKPEGVTLKIKVAGSIEPPTKAAMVQLVQSWSNHIALYLDGNGLPGRMVINPKTSNNKTTFTMFYNLFTFEPKPARDMLVNMLIHFHEKVAPLAEVELGFQEPLQ